MPDPANRRPARTHTEAGCEAEQKSPPKAGPNRGSIEEIWARPLPEHVRLRLVHEVRRQRAAARAERIKKSDKKAEGMSDMSE